MRVFIIKQILPAPMWRQMPLASEHPCHGYTLGLRLYLCKATITELHLCEEILFPSVLYVRTSSWLHVLSSWLLIFVIFRSSVLSFQSALCWMQCSWTTILLSVGRESSGGTCILGFSINPENVNGKWITHAISIFCCINGRFPRRL